MADIALGMKEAGLEAFAAMLNASYMSQWLDLGLYDDDVEGWGEAFFQAVTRTLSVGGRIHFCLDGLDIAEALNGDPNIWSDRYTAWELQQIVRNLEWFESTHFYLNGELLNSERLVDIGIAPHQSGPG
jgi:hypothetical protein